LPLEIQSCIDLGVDQDTLGRPLLEPLADVRKGHFMDLDLFMSVSAAWGDPPKTARLEEGDDFGGQTGRGGAGGQADHLSGLIAGLFQQLATGGLGEGLGRMPGGIAGQTGREFDDAAGDRNAVLFREHDFGIVGHGHNRHCPGRAEALGKFPPTAFDDSKELAFPLEDGLIVHFIMKFACQQKRSGALFALPGSVGVQYAAFV
jgi:hypothetical protein